MTGTTREITNNRLCCVEGVLLVGGRTKNVVVGMLQGTGVYVWVVFRSNRVGKVQVQINREGFDIELGLSR